MLSDFYPPTLLVTFSKLSPHYLLALSFLKKLPKKPSVFLSQSPVSINWKQTNWGQAASHKNYEDKYIKKNTSFSIAYRTLTQSWHFSPVNSKTANETQTNRNQTVCAIVRHKSVIFQTHEPG